MTNTKPATWKFATLQQDGSIEIQWQIRQPYRSMGIIILKEGDSLYTEVLEETKKFQPGRRVSLGGPTMDDIEKQVKDQENSQEFQEFLTQNASMIEEMEKQYPNLRRKTGTEDQ